MGNFAPCKRIDILQLCPCTNPSTNPSATPSTTPKYHALYHSFYHPSTTPFTNTGSTLSSPLVRFPVPPMLIYRLQPHIGLIMRHYIFSFSYHNLSRIVVLIQVCSIADLGPLHQSDRSPPGSSNRKRGGWRPGFYQRIYTTGDNGGLYGTALTLIAGRGRGN